VIAKMCEENGLRFEMGAKHFRIDLQKRLARPVCGTYLQDGATARFADCMSLLFISGDFRAS